MPLILQHFSKPSSSLSFGVPCKGTSEAHWGEVLYGILDCERSGVLKFIFDIILLKVLFY
jgi:hypothetical protein